MFLAQPVRAEILVGRIIGVADGDTLTLLDSNKQSHKIRLGGIDVPEKKQDFGEQSKLSLSNLAYGRQATAECTKRDRYQRAVCVVTVAGKDVGLQQIHLGLAWWYQHYAREQRQQESRDYERAEQVAREARRGLWRDEKPTPPWEWRHARRAKSATLGHEESGSVVVACQEGKSGRRIANVVRV